MEHKYPKDSEIKVKWTAIHSIIVISGTLVTIGYIVHQLKINFSVTSKIISVFGLYLNILGVALSSLKTPYYGSFFDGGELEVKRLKAEKKYFNLGIYTIIIGVILSIIGIVY